MNEYRYERGTSPRQDISTKYVTLGPLPRDRKGLILLWHPVVDHPDLHDNNGLATPFHNMAKRIAMKTEQHVFIVQDEQRWCMLIFGEEMPDEDEGGTKISYDRENENDQYIAFYDPEGSFTFVGCS